VQIRKVARLGTGHTPSRSVEEYWEPAECTIPWLTLADVWQLRDGSVSVVTETKEKISPLGLANSAAVRHPAGTVAFSRTASVGFSCILGVDMATSQDFVTWTCGPQLDPRYLLWVLRAERDEILSRTQGSTHKTIYMPDIEQLTIPLPALDEQVKIAEFLDARSSEVHKAMADLEDLLCLSEERHAAVAETAFEGWEAVPLRRLLQRPPQYGLGESGVPDEDAEASWPRYIRITDLNEDGTLRHADVKRLQPTIAARHLLKDGDVLVARSGATVGKSFLYQRDMGRATFAGYLIRLTSDDSRLLPSLLRTWMTTPRYWSQIRASQIQATIENVSAERYKDLLVPLPPREVQPALLADLAASQKHVSRLRSWVDTQQTLMRERLQSMAFYAVDSARETA
jgi:type I restriction enzyme S subunit